MDFDMLFLANPGEKSTKNLLMRSLAALQKASAVQLHHFIKKEFSRSLSYQAIRQSLLELIDDGAIVRNGKLYSIRPSWIAELKETVRVLEKSQEKADMRIIDKHTTQVDLKNLGELGHFILLSLEQEYFDLQKGKDIYVSLSHLWIPFSDRYKRERTRQVFLKNTTHCVVRGKSMGDRLLKRWYKQFGTVKLGVKNAPRDYIVHADCVIQMFFPDELIKAMTKAYRMRFSILQDISEMTYDYPIQLVITRNAAIAEQMREEIKKHI
ncbi:MAG: hypothetical protein OXR66_02505 [Candidatus Woesearchaeota archaeon]|nr:hypothetical protein [Candidatus Woesearchaeota archaeon]